MPAQPPIHDQTDPGQTNPDHANPGQVTSGPRQRLIDAAVAHAAAHGLADTSLRQLATALGTSHRMLIHHFGSKEGLLVEVVRAVEHRQRELLVELSRHGGEVVSQDDLGRRFWDSLNNAQVAQHERLFFEVYGQALQGRPWATPLLEGIVDNWIEPLVTFFVARGVSPATAHVDARLAVAVSRGLLLDVLATGNHTAVDAAMNRFMELLTRDQARSTSGSAPAQWVRRSRSHSGKSSGGSGSAVAP